MNASDPYEKASISENPREHVYVQKSASRPSGGCPPVVNSPDATFSTSVTAIAFIPPKALPPIFDIFEDDHTEQQPRLLPDAHEQGNFRMLHGFRLDWGTLPFNNEARVKDLRVLECSNPTRFRILPLGFPSNPEFAHHPGWLLPPPPHNSAFTIAVGNSMRSMNGFLGTPLGKAMAWVRAESSKRAGHKNPDDLPRIGSTLNLWTTPEGCRAIVTMHNRFPKYVYYLDGIQVPWDNEPKRSFQEFDGYEIEVEWRPTIGLALYAAMTNYPPDHPRNLRYPAGCTFGWWRGVSPPGLLDWCGNRTPLTHINFEPIIDSLDADAWLDALEHYAQIVRERVREGEDEPSSEETRMLDSVWKRLAPENWQCRRFWRDQTQI
jgi:hypothetical protein